MFAVPPVKNTEPVKKYRLEENVRNLRPVKWTDNNFGKIRQTNGRSPNSQSRPTGTHCAILIISKVEHFWGGGGKGGGSYG